MRARNAAWERAAEVRAAARAWKEAGAIGAETLAAVDARYPDPRILPSGVFQVLTFVFTSVAILAIAWFSLTLFRPRGAAENLLIVLLGAASAGAAEALDASPRWTARGAAGAASFWGIVLVLTGAGLHASRAFDLREDAVIEVVLALATVLFSLAAIRWGVPVYAGFGLGLLLLLAAGKPAPWAWWLALGLGGAVLCSRSLDRASWAPSHRRAAAVGLAVCLAAAYAAVNVYVLETGGIPSLRSFRRAAMPLSPALFGVAAAATAILPLALLVLGLRTRRRLLIDLGAVLVALSFVTLRHYVALAPLWVILTGAGLVVAGLGFFFERFLQRAKGGERGGFTARPLYSGEGLPRGLDWVPAAAAYAPGPAAPGPRPEGFTGQGGTFGGGGASGTF